MAYGKVLLSFNTQPPEGGWMKGASFSVICTVSTHSRPKAAGGGNSDGNGDGSGFNTQPPEGGWFCSIRFILIFDRFNTQPPEGGWAVRPSACRFFRLFQHTAARRRLGRCRHRRDPRVLFQHTAARRRLVFRCPPVYPLRGFNTQPPEGGWIWLRSIMPGMERFQHTAA